jgi:hypothetical protein
MREIKRDITQIRTKEWRNKADWGEWGNKDWETEINEKKRPIKETGTMKKN